MVEVFHGTFPHLGAIAARGASQAREDHVAKQAQRGELADGHVSPPVSHELPDYSRPNRNTLD